MPTPDEIFQMAKRIIDAQLSSGRPQPDGTPSLLFRTLDTVLGKEWWRTFPVDEIEKAVQSLEDSPTSSLFPGVIKELRAVIDMVRAERIAATSVNDPLDDQDVWSKASDRVKAGWATGGPPVKNEADMPIYTEGYRAGYVAGFRRQAGFTAADAKGYPLSEGDQVMKVSGDYIFPGRIVTIFKKVDDETVRVVVESTSEDTRGMLHVFNPSQLQKMWPIEL